MQYGTNPYNLPTKTGWAMPISTNKPRQWTTTSSPTTEGNTGSLSPFEDDQFDFDATTGTAVFTMSSNPAAPKLTSKTVFALAMENSKTASDCKTVTLTASGPDISQTVTMNSPAYQRALIDGEMDGDACPLKVYEPGFLTKIISSSNIVSDSANNLLVTLRSNVDLASDASFKSTITISGLTGSSGTKPSISSVAHAFTPAFDSPDWTASSGTLVLTLAGNAACVLPGGATAKSNNVQCMKAGVQYEFQISLRNGKVAQAAPPISIEGSYQSGKTIRKQVVDGPIDTACNQQPALRIVPESDVLCKYKIGQVTSGPGARNAICVTLQTYKNLQSTTFGDTKRFVAFTLTGLTGFNTDGQDLPLVDTDGESYWKGSQSSTQLEDLWCKKSTCAASDLNQVKFSETSGEAEFYLSPTKTMSTGTDYKVCFQVTNSKTASKCKEVSIKVKDSSVSAAAAMVLPMTQASGNNCAGFTSEPTFTANIRTSSNATNMEAHLQLEFVPNYKVAANSIVTISGLDGYTTSSTDLPFTLTKNGKIDSAVLGTKATWDSAGLLKLTVAGNDLTFKDALSNSGSMTYDETPEEDDVYVVSFLLKNPASAQAGKTVAITSSGFQADGLVDSGFMRSRRSKLAGTSRRSDGLLQFTFTPKTAIAKGESIILTLPKYKIEVEGPVFGITSSPEAFTTYAQRSDWEVNGIGVSKARAMFTNGESQTASKRSGLDGFFMLDDDDDGINSNKHGWFSETTVWEGTVLAGTYIAATGNGATGGAVDSPCTGVERPAGSYPTGTAAVQNPGCPVISTANDYTGNAYTQTQTDEMGTVFNAAPANNVAGVPLPAAATIYQLSATTRYKGQTASSNPTDIRRNELVGMRLTCSATVSGTGTTTSSTHIFGSSTYATESKYILGNDNLNIVVEKAFSAEIFSTAVGATPLNAQCRIEHKPTVGKYTGMMVMFDNGKEYTLKQGAGALYQVSDGSGMPPSAHDIEGREYTIYSQLEMTASDTVSAGETVTITIPKSAGITAPSDVTKPVVKGYDDKTIADVSTIRRVFASALGEVYSPNTPRVQESAPVFSGLVPATKSTARLSRFGGPYAFSDDIGPHLLNKRMDAYGTLDLLATTQASANEDGDNRIALSTTASRVSANNAIWKMEQLYAGGGFAIGEENYGMTAPRDVSALATTIAVSDASSIDAGDSLFVGDEFMYVESKTDNYLKVQRGVAGTQATSHRSIPDLTNTPTVLTPGTPAIPTDAGTAATAAQHTFAADPLGPTLNANNQNPGFGGTNGLDGVPAHGWVTIWKKDANKYSYHLTATTSVPMPSQRNGVVDGAAQEVTLDVASSGTTNAPANDQSAGANRLLGNMLLLAGGAGGEFLAPRSATASQITVRRQDHGEPNRPYVAGPKRVHHEGDSLVPYTCAFGTGTSTSDTPVGNLGAGNRDNTCKTVALLGLTVIPVHTIERTDSPYAAKIETGDFLRIAYPDKFYPGRSTGAITAPEEELYRVDGVDGNDVIVTSAAKVLGSAATNVLNVHRWPGGTGLDLLKKTSTTVTFTGSMLLNINTEQTTGSTAGLSIAVGDYCLIENEFKLISAIGVSGLTFNAGHGSFGTVSTTHRANSKCTIFKYLNPTVSTSVKDLTTNNANAFTYIYDPRVTIRRVSTAISQVGAGALAGVPGADVSRIQRAQDTFLARLDLVPPAKNHKRYGSEIVDIIGDPLEPRGTEFPVRSGTDFVQRFNLNPGVEPALTGDMGFTAGAATVNTNNNNAGQPGITGVAGGSLGFDYQIDSYQMKAGKLYLVGSLGDMLQDVKRDSCYRATIDAELTWTAAQASAGTILTVPGNAAGAGAASSGTLIPSADNFNRLKRAGLTVGSLLSSDAANAGTSPEYYEVTAIAFGTRTISLNRMVNLPCVVRADRSVANPPRTSTSDTPVAATPFRMMVQVDTPREIMGTKSKTTRFMDPWGQGSNVTAFCDKVSTVTAQQIQDGIIGGTRLLDDVVAIGANRGTSYQFRVQRVDQLNAKVGDFVEVWNQDGDTEFFKVYQITPAGTTAFPNAATLAVIRGATPNCVDRDPEGGLQATATANADYVRVLKKRYDVVNFQDAFSPTGASSLTSRSMRGIFELSPREPVVWVEEAPTAPAPTAPAPTAPAPTEDNLLLLLLRLLLIPIAAAAYWCCKKEAMAPVGKPMAPVYLPQPYPVLEMSPQPVMMAPMPMVEMSPQPVMMAPMPMVEMSPQPVMMAPMGMQPPMPAPAQPMQYGM